MAQLVARGIRVPEAGGSSPLTPTKDDKEAMNNNGNHRKKDSAIKLPRTDEDLLISLRKHISLLQDYHNYAFSDNDSRYYGEVAGKLRLLIYRSRTCKPLLLDLMDKYNIKVRLNLIGPGNRHADIQEYFHEVCGVFQSPTSKKLVKIKPIDIIRIWAEQIGASHEDKEVDKNFFELLSHQFFINNRQIAVDELRRSSSFVLTTAKFFFEDIDKQFSN